MRWLAQVRYLISAFCAVAILLAAPADTAVAASSACGRVTAYVLCVTAPGYVVLTTDRTDATVIVPAGMTSAGLAGYVCLGMDRDALTGLLTPGMVGYFPELREVSSLGLAVAGYAAAGLPNTSTSASTGRAVPVLAAWAAAVLALGVLALRPRRAAA